jgi:MFS family permease
VVRISIYQASMQPIVSTTRIPLALLARILLPFGLGYFLSFLYRTVNAAIGPDLVETLNLSTADLGLLTSTYFATFALFQIPLGVLLDRYGPRIVEAALLLVAAGGALVFASADSLLALIIGRGLIGLGVSACLMAAMKANVQSWPAERLPLANGTILAMGGLGAIVATAPVQALLSHVDWRGLFVGLAVATLIVAFGIFGVAPKAPARSGGESWRSAVVGAAGVYVSPLFLRIAPLAVLNQASFLAYHGLWASDWLREVQGLGRDDANSVLAIATIGIVLGTFGSGLIADRLARKGISTLRVAVSLSALYMVVQLALIFKLTVPASLLWGAFAFFGMSSALYYAVLGQSFPIQLGGRVNTALNMLVFVAAFLLQWAIGSVLGLWGGDVAEAHQLILTSVLALQVGALTWLLFARRLAVQSD